MAGASYKCSPETRNWKNCSLFFLAAKKVTEDCSEKICLTGMTKTTFLDSQGFTCIAFITENVSVPKGVTLAWPLHQTSFSTGQGFGNEKTICNKFAMDICSSYRPMYIIANYLHRCLGTS